MKRNNTIEDLRGFVEMKNRQAEREETGFKIKLSWVETFENLNGKKVRGFVDARIENTKPSGRGILSRWDLPLWSKIWWDFEKLDFEDIKFELIDIIDLIRELKGVEDNDI